MSVSPLHALCLGGPLDGQIIPAKSGVTVGMAPVVGSDRGTGIIGYREVRYTRRRLAGRDDAELVYRELVVYACEDITDELELYRRLVGHLVKLAIGQSYVGQRDYSTDERESVLRRRDEVDSLGRRIDVVGRVQ